MDTASWRTWLLAALAGVVTSCTSSAQPFRGTTLPEPDPSRHTGGTVTIGLWQEPDSLLDAGIVDRGTFASAIAAPVAEGLLWYRPVAETARAHQVADDWRPLLATEVPTLANGGVRTRDCLTSGAAMCVVWRLRSGVRWHDGSELTAHDVCDTFRLFYLRYHDNNPTALLSTEGWDQVLQCTEVAPLTAVVDFKTQYGPYLSLGSGVYGILPAAILDRAFASNADLQSVVTPVDLSRGSGTAGAFRGAESLDRMIDGTGPFVFAGYQPGKQMVLLPNRHYWDPAHGARLDKLVFTFEPDLATTVSAVRSGAVDAAFDLRLANLPELLGSAAAAGLSVRAVPGAGAEKLDVNVCAAAGAACVSPGARASEYTGDPVVRRAILTGLNRPAIAAAATAGTGVIPPDAWIALGVPWLRGASPTTAYDPAAANALLDQAGYARSPACGGQVRAYRDGSCLAVALGTTSEDPVRLATERQVAADLIAIGIGVGRPFGPNLPSASFFGSFADGGPLHTHGFDLALYAGGLISPGEPDRLYATFHADCHSTCPKRSQIPSSANDGSGQNVTGEDAAALDSALDAGRSTADPEGRRRAYLAAAGLLARDLPEIPLFQQLTVQAFSTTIQGVEDNDAVWDFNVADWGCPGGRCQRSP